jgi:parvulin-like peptidyl-prolyl isomerase
MKPALKIPLMTKRKTFFNTFIGSFFLSLMILFATSFVVIAAEPKDIVASFKGGKITLEQVDSEISSKPIFARFKQQNPAKLDELRKTVLNTIINRQLLLGVVAESDKVDEKSVEEEVKKVVDGYGGQAKLTELLKKINTPYDKFLGDIKNDYRLQSYIKNVIAPTIKISEEEIKKEFESNRASYDTPETVQASHILIKTDGAKLKEEEIVDKLMKIREDLLAKKIEFSTAAKQNSECPSAQAGGNLGIFTKGQMVPEFEKVAFSLEKGEISKPVKTKFGYHLIMAIEHNKPIKSTLEGATANVKQKLTKEESDKKVNLLVEELRKSANVKINL